MSTSPPPRLQRIAFLFVLAVFFSVLSAHGQGIAEEALLRATNADNGDRFGTSVSIDGDRAVVGATLEDGANDMTSSSGAVYIFERRENGTWTQVALLRASNTGSDDRFGRDVAIDGDHVIVGASFEDGANDMTQDTGAAYIFHRQQDDTWEEAALLRASDADADDEFGASVAIYDSYAVATSLRGAYIFKRQNNGSWSQTDRVTSSNFADSDRFGQSVSLYDSRLVVGAPDEDGPDNNQIDQGAAYIFELQSDETWTQVDILRGSNSGNSDNFGWAVSTSVNRVLVGARSEDGAGNPIGLGSSGAAYLFELQSNGDWDEVEILRASNAGGGDNFGYSVSLDGDRAVVGSLEEDGSDDSIYGAGAAYVYERQGNGTWSERSILRASNAERSDEFGDPVSLDGDLVVSGATFEDGVDNSLSSSGAAYVINLNANVSITDGSADGLALEATTSRGTDDNLIGALELSTNAGGISLDELTITNSASGTPGITEATLYASPDLDLDPTADTELSAVTVDPASAPATFSFNGFSEGITNTPTYFLVAIDITSDAPETPIALALADDAALSLTTGAITSVNGAPAMQFTDLPLSTGSVALPVELADFTARPVDEDVTLTWRTLSETKNDRFEIERRIDDVSDLNGSERMQQWVQVGSVEGAGTTVSGQRYVYDDTAVPYEVNTLSYRLKQVDVDGSASYTQPVRVQREANSSIELLSPYPNPSASQATIRVKVPKETNEAVLVVYDLLGRSVRTLPVSNRGRQKIQMNTADLAPGVYFLRLTVGSQSRTEKMTVIQ